MPVNPFAEFGEKQESKGTLAPENPFSMFREERAGGPVESGLSEHRAAQRAGVEPPDPYPVGQQVMRGMARGVGQATANIAGLPSDLNEWLVNSLIDLVLLEPLDDQVNVDLPGGAEDILKVMEEHLGIPKAKGAPMVERIVGRMTEEVAGGAMFGGGLAGLTRKRLGAMIKKEWAPTLGGSIGAGVANYLDPNNTALDVTGTLTGSFTPSAFGLTGRLIGKGARGVGGALGVGGPEGRKIAKDIISTQVGDPGQAIGMLDNYVENLRALGIPTNRVNVVDAIGSPFLADYANKTVSPRLFDRFKAIEARNDQHLRGIFKEYYQEVPGQVTLEKAREIEFDIRKGIQDEIKASQEIIAAEMMRDMRPDLGPSVRAKLRAQAEHAFTENFKEIEQKSRERRNALYDAVPGKVFVPNKHIYDMYEHVKGMYKESLGHHKGDNPSAALQYMENALFNKVPTEDGFELVKKKGITWEIVNNLARTLGTEIEQQTRRMGTASGDVAPTYEQLKRIRLLRRSLDNTLKHMTLGNGISPEVAAKARAAREYAKVHIETFKRGVGASQLRKELLQRPKIAHERSVSSFFRSNNKRGAQSAAQEVMKVFGHKQDALDEMMRWATVDLYEKATKGGQLDVKLMRKWIGNHSHALEVFPKFRAQLFNVTKMQGRIDTLMGDLKAHDKMNNTAIAKALLDEDDLGLVVEELTRSSTRRGMKEKSNKVVRMLRKDPYAMEGMRTELWQHMLQVMEGNSRFGGGIILNPEMAMKYIDKNEEMFKAFYSEGHLEDVRKVLGRTADVARNGPEWTARMMGVDDKPLFGFNMAVSRGWTAARTFVSRQYVMLDSAARYLHARYKMMSRKEAQVIMEEALVNPELMTTMLEEIKTVQDAKKHWRRVRAHLISVGATTVEALNDIDKAAAEEAATSASP